MKTHKKLITTGFVAISSAMLLTSCAATSQQSSTSSEAASNQEISTVEEYDENSEEISVNIDEEDGQKTTLLSDYTEFKSANIPDIPQEEKNLEAEGAENVLFDTKQAGDLSVLLIGNNVSADSENSSEIVNCFDFGVALSDGENVSEICSATAEFIGAAQGGYNLYTEKLSDYTSVYQFGENYIIALRYFDSDNSSLAAFYAVKDEVLYPLLMGDYSAAGGEELAVVTVLSENISVDEENCALTDLDNGILFTFNFDAIGDTFTTAHYIAESI